MSILSRIVVWGIVMIMCLTGAGFAEAADQKVKIGICFTAVGPGDLSFNNMLYKGSIELQGKYPELEFAYQTAAADTDADIQRALTALVDQGANLVLTLGFQSLGALNAVAKLFPATHFVLFDVAADPAENVTSVIFAQHEGAFVAGALMARVTRTKSVGFIGGVNLDVLKAFEQGFREGIAYIDPAVSFVVEYCSQLPDFSGFSTPAKGYAVATRMFTEGVDIVFNGAGASGPGIIQAAVEQKKYVIGSDANQDYLAPGLVLTSIMKRLDIAMMDMCEKFLHGEFSGKTVLEYGYHNGGISLTPMEFTKQLLPAGVLDEITAIEQKIMNREIVVTNILAQPK
jgi:basic membrane protein A and related proteins